MVVQIESQSIPDLSGRESGFDYHVKSMKIKKCDLSKTTISFRESPQGLAISVPLSIEIDGKWDYKLHSFPHVPQGKGSFSAKAGGSSKLSTVLTLGAGSNGNPTVSASGTSCKLSVNVKTSGSLFSWLYNLIIGAFKGKIGDQICSQAKSGINQIIATTLADALKQLPTTFPVQPLPPQLQYDKDGKPFKLAVVLGLSSNPIVTASDISVPIRAEVINQERPQQTTPPVLARFNAGDAHMLAVQFSKWSCDRTLDVFQEAGFLN